MRGPRNRGPLKIPMSISPSLLRPLVLFSHSCSLPLSSPLPVSTLHPDSHSQCIKPVIVYLMVILTWIAVVILELIHAPKPDFLEGLCLYYLQNQPRLRLVFCSSSPPHVLTSQLSISPALIRSALCLKRSESSLSTPP